MARLVGKTVDFVFDARAVTWADTFNLAHKHGTAVKARADDVVGAFIGMGDPARHLLGVHVCATHITKDGHVGRHSTKHTVSRLLHALAKVNRAPIDSWGRTGFKTALRQLQFF